MKKIQYILPALLLLLSVSCTREVIESAEPVSASAGDKVPIIMSFADNITLQASTKAEDGMEMGVNPAIKTIHVAVFGSSGYLKDYSSAIPCDSEGNPLSGFVSANATTGYFKVYLSFDEGPSNRRIHIIANGPASLPFNASEDSIMKSLAVTDGNGAYWTRLVTSKASGEGILIKTTTDALTGEVTRDVDPVTGDYIPTDGTKALFQNLKLVRNFAGITVIKTGSDTNFAIDGFTVCNMPDKGAVAIYNETSSEWIPGDGYAGLSMDANSLLTYNATLYPGFPTDPSLDTHIPQSEAEFNAAGVSVAPGETIYFYERAVSDKAAPFVLIKARYIPSGTVDAGSPTYYYRLDITPGSNYVPFYRNFKYNVKVSGIKVPGSSTPGEAAKRNSGDNFSVSMDTQDLPSVSNGSTSIFVKETDIAGIYSAGSKEFWYQFEVEGDFFNGTSAQSAGTGTAIVSVEETKTGALASWSVEGTDRAGDKRYITYTLNEPAAGETLTSVLRIKGDYTPGGGGTISLIRDVTITVVSPQALTVSFSPNVIGTGVGKQTTLNIDLPADLPRGFFPLVFKIEDTALGLNADEENVPVNPGASIINPSENAYQFVKTLNWSEYEELIEEAELSGLSHPVLPIKMKTSKLIASTTAYVSSTYFGTATAGLTIDSDNYITPANITVDYNAHDDIAVTVVSNSKWTLNLARDNGSSSVGASLSLSYGSATAGQAVTVTLPENPGKISRTYVLTLRHADSDLVRRAYIVQTGKKFELSAPHLSVKGNTTVATMSLHSDYDGAWTVSVPAPCSLSRTSGTGKGDFEITLTMPVNNSTTENVARIVTATHTGEGLVSSLTIEQRRASFVPTTVVFNTRTGAEAAYRYSTSKKTVTMNGIQGTFEDITSVSSDYLAMPLKKKLTVSIADPSLVQKITSIVITYPGNAYAGSAGSATVNAGGDNNGYTFDTSVSPRTGTWTGDATSIELTIDRTENNNSIRIRQYVVVCNMKAWY